MYTQIGKTERESHWKRETGTQFWTSIETIWGLEVLNRRPGFRRKGSAGDIIKDIVDPEDKARMRCQMVEQR